MDQPTCRAVLDGPPSALKAELLDAIQVGLFDCEQHAHPESKSAVGNDEWLNFVVFDPQQVFEDGSLKPTALMQVDLGGLSVLRDDASDAEFEITVRQMREKDDGRRLFGVARFQSIEIRFHGDQRFVGVYDTPLDRKPNHADIFAPIWGGM